MKNLKSVIFLLLISLVTLPAFSMANVAVDANNTLTYKLFTQMASDQNGQISNIFISPYSIFSALDLAYTGAGGSTKAAFETFYNLPPGSDLATSFLSMNTVLGTDRGANEVFSANALWVDKSIILLPSYLSQTKNYYSADETTLDFHDAQNSADTVNGWVSSHTKDKIHHILTAEDLESSSVILTNAIYFYGHWDKNFDKSQTRKQPFFLSNNAAKNIDFMHDKDRYIKYLETDSAQIAELPYKGENLSMLIILPKNRGEAALTQIIKSFPEQVKAYDAATGLRKIKINSIALPKFKFESAVIPLKDNLKAVGLELPFEKNANFSGISQTPFYIEKVLHKALIEVNEEGTEATAATVVAMPTASAFFPHPTLNLIVDHPFLFLIRDTKIGLILFSGLIVDP